MKKVLIFSVASIAIIFSSCSKKEDGICYCTYFSGDKKQFDLRHLSDKEQKDSCAYLSQLASNFAGSCKVK